MNILAVDDEYFSLELMKSALGEVAAGANLFPCLDVQSALQVAKETRIDVAFLDIHMPEMTGVELARELKDINPKVNIIFATGFSEHMKEGIDLRMSGYIMKPVTPEAVKTELESMGATVILNRTTDSSMDTDLRVETLVNCAPDLCIAIHQDVYAQDSKVSGFSSRFFTPFSQPAANKICEQTAKTDIYTKSQLRWDVYFTCRQSICPVVLTESGYMTNPADLSGMINDSTLASKAHAIAQGVADYFLSINK